MSLYFHYLQIKNLVTSMYGSTHLFIPTPFEKLCKAGVFPKGLILAIFTILKNPPPEVGVPPYIHA